MAISQIWLPQPRLGNVVGQHLVDVVRRTLPFAWVPAAVGAVAAVPALASLNGAAQWAVLGVIAMTVVWAQLFSLVAWSGSEALMSRHEDHSTDDVLRPLRKQGWKVLRETAVGSRTVDHVAVGPGGVLVMESRFRRTLTADDLEWAARQAQRSRRDVLGALGTAFEQVPVLPVIVAWNAESVDTPTFVGGVRVVRGNQLAEYLELFQVERLSADQVTAGAALLAPRPTTATAA